MVSLSNRRVTFEISDAPAAHEKGGVQLFGSQCTLPAVRREKKNTNLYFFCSRFSIIEIIQTPEADLIGVFPNSKPTDGTRWRKSFGKGPREPTRVTNPPHKLEPSAKGITF